MRGGLEYGVIVLLLMALAQRFYEEKAMMASHADQSAELNRLVREKQRTLREVDARATTAERARRSAEERATALETQLSEWRQKFGAAFSRAKECSDRVGELEARERERSSTPPPTPCPPPPECVCPPPPPPCPEPAPAEAAAVNVTETYAAATRRFKPTSRFLILDWEAFNPRHVFSPHRVKGRINRGGATGAETTEVIQFASSRLQEDDSSESPGKWKFAHGNMRVHPLLGTEYLVDFVKKPSSDRPEFKRVGVLRAFSPALAVVPSYGVPPSSPALTGTLYMVMPLAGRTPVLSTFLEMLAEAVPLPGGQSVHLTISFFREPEQTDDEYKASLRNITAHLAEHKAAGLSSRVVEVDGNFSRGRGLEVGANSIEPESPGDPVLVFFVDVDMWFDSSFLFRCRATPEPGVRVYYPTVFSLYEKHVSIAAEMQNAGLWREAGFGMLCVYREDFRELGGFDKKIDGWGKEDVDLFDRMIRRFDVVRAVDDGIMHKWHDKECDPNLDEKQLIMCNGAKANLEGDKMALGAKLARARFDLGRCNATVEALRSGGNEE